MSEGTTEKVSVTIKQNGKERKRLVSRGMIEHVRAWAEENDLDIVIEENVR